MPVAVDLRPVAAALHRTPPPVPGPGGVEARLAAPAQLASRSRFIEAISAPVATTSAGSAPSGVAPAQCARSAGACRISKRARKPSPPVTLASSEAGGARVEGERLTVRMPYPHVTRYTGYRHPAEGKTMGKLYAVEYVTLDGVFEEPAWSGPYFNDELGSWQDGNLKEADALLLGRRTYEGFKAAWPHMEEETGHFGKKMNGMPKHVATTTLTEPEWNATFIAGDVAEAVAELKAGPGSLMVNGSATLLNYLTRHNLVDEYRIMIYPVVVGAGRKLWDEGTKVALTLTNSFTTTTGVEVITYVPA
jgi:dihydrofolate reductase